MYVPTKRFTKNLKMETKSVEVEKNDNEVINVIPVRFDANYEELGGESAQFLSSGASKGKYYKQMYRTAWEQMPDFKGWLRGVDGEPTRAYCTYCQKTLHAHRLSLLKHTCTLRHQKAAQIHTIRKRKRTDHCEESVESGDDMEVGKKDMIYMDYKVEDDNIEYPETSDEVENEIEDHEDEEEEEEEDQSFLNFPKQVSNNQNSNMNCTKPPISTHVLDTSKGAPVDGLQCSLYKLINGRWTYINEGMTSADGRFAGFVEQENFTAGRYKLHYDVDRYFKVKKQETLYPFIEIIFDCRSSTEHYHIPLLLSPFGYTTYRGS